jgi:hypothetical protein
MSKQPVELCSRIRVTLAIAVSTGLIRDAAALVASYTTMLPRRFWNCQANANFSFEIASHEQQQQDFLVVTARHQLHVFFVRDETGRTFTNLSEEESEVLAFLATHRRDNRHSSRLHERLCGDGTCQRQPLLHRLKLGSEHVYVLNAHRCGRSSVILV